MRRILKRLTPKENSHDCDDTPEVTICGPSDFVTAPWSNEIVLLIETEAGEWVVPLKHLQLAEIQAEAVV